MIRPDLPGIITAISHVEHHGTTAIVTMTLNVEMHPHHLAELQAKLKEGESPKVILVA